MEVHELARSARVDELEVHGAREQHEVGIAVLREERGQPGIGRRLLSEHLGSEVTRVENLPEVAGVRGVSQPSLLRGTAAGHEEDEEEGEPGEPSHGRFR
jgi:hypothetical protein